MSLLHAIFFGIFVLILTYLALTNAKGVAGITQYGSNALVANITALQGR